MSNPEESRYDSSIYTLPSTAPFIAFAGMPPNKEKMILPTDIPSTFSDSMSEAYSVNPEQVLNKFLEANPNFYNPRDIARIIFHSPNVSPYANALILFNSSFSSKSLRKSFITAIDLDCIALIDAISFITSKVAFIEDQKAINEFVTEFSHVYCMRNQLEWPDPAVVKAIFFSVIKSLFFRENFTETIKNYPVLSKVPNCVLDQLTHEISVRPPPIYFACCPCNASDTLQDQIEHEGRFMSSWSSYYYRKEGKLIQSYKDSKSKEVLSKIPLENVSAAPKSGIKGKPWVLVLSKGGQEFGQKFKDGAMRNSPRTSYTFSFRSESELLTWISSINYNLLIDRLKNLK